MLAKQVKRRKDFAKMGSRVTSFVSAFCLCIIVVVGAVLIAIGKMAASGIAAIMLYMGLVVLAFLAVICIWYGTTTAIQYVASQYEEGQKAFEKLQSNFKDMHDRSSQLHERFFSLMHFCQRLTCCRST